MITEYVILVDEQDNMTGFMEKMEAHTGAHLHRAFSVFIFNSSGKLLLQQRALTKYHSPGLWTNTCCSHPRPGEETAEGAHRRMEEEMGFDCSFEKAFSFIYKAELDNHLTEHEFDHVFIGTSDTTPQVNPDEVADYRYATIEQVRAEMDQHPESFTIWFRIAFDRVEAYFRENLKKN